MMILHHLKNPSYRIKFLITNPSSELAFFINPSIHKGKEGGEVLPSFWDDNYFSLLPGRSKELEVEFTADVLEGEAAFFKLVGWNVAPRMIRIK